MFVKMEESSSDDNVNTLSNTLRLASLVTPSKPTDGKRRNRRRKRPLSKDAMTILCAITGSPYSELCQSLYKAHILDISDETRKNIAEYVLNSQEHGFGIKVTNILRIVRNNDRDFDDDKTTKRFRMMLWHGTKKASVAPILKSGFARPANKSQMFGLGVYFADRASKSARYCDSTTPGSVGYMFLCDVDLGKMYKALKPHTDYTEPPQNYDTVKCQGENRPDWKLNKKIGRSILPSGPTVKDTRFEKHTIIFNEYVVYDPLRVKPKYLVLVEFQQTKCLS